MAWKTLSVVALGALLVAGNAAAADSEGPICPDSPKDKWAKPEAVTAMLSKIIDKEFELGLDKGCYEAEVVINEQTMIDIYVDPVTMQIVHIRSNGAEDS
ncbi:MAG TPA: PepSY domain-containing protein [Methylomirabilota bacterium]|nr:PepSY domain-containing protein [Methylomirabilota bacterium]